jgi:hypothetical protein
MINQLLLGNGYLEGSYLRKFQQAQRNLELVCEEYKSTKLCKRQHVWRERRSVHKTHDTLK